MSNHFHDSNRESLNANHRCTRQARDAEFSIGMGLRRMHFWLFIAAAGLLLTFGFLSVASWAGATPPASAAEPQRANQKAEPPASKAEETPPPPSGMSYTTSLDRTAIWVGDQFHYTITVDYSPEFEFVLDNLSKEDVSMDPFIVVDVTRKTAPLINNKTRLVVDITLSNFSFEPDRGAHPAAHSLLFHAEDQRTVTAEQAAAESLTVPGPAIGLRSTLTPNPAALRDSATVIAWKRSRWVVPAVGFAALALLVAWLGWEAYLFFKKRGAAQGPDRRRSMEAVRARWASAVPSDLSDSQSAREFFDQSYESLKEYLGHYLQADTAGLTADEVKEEMLRSGATSDVSQKVGRILSACEAARYSGNGLTTNVESARGVAQDMREVMTLVASDQGN